jgi:hypothetical protein
VAPFTALATSRTSRDRIALERDYALGRALGREAIGRFEQLQASARPGTRAGVGGQQLTA